MPQLNLNSEESAAIVGWNHRGLAGYAVHDGQYWSCVASDPIGDARHTCRSSDSAMHWLRHTANAVHFESLADEDELDQLIHTTVPGLASDATHLAEMWSDH